MNERKGINAGKGERFDPDESSLVKTKRNESG